MTSQELRTKFLEYFKSKGHEVLPSASLVPADDTSVLFTTAGMQRFRRYYANPDEAPATAIATSQKCLRTSDIDEVGDKSHLTFFEMLGNFSFGKTRTDADNTQNDAERSYFKKEAILYGWEFLTKVLKIDPTRIYASYFKDDRSGIAEDKESLEILQQIKELKKIEPQGFDDNFWSLGTENSPGGPTVEFYVDNIELWNLVFNQYVFIGGKYQASRYQGVDTGMGLERLAAVMQNKTDIYQTDLFWPMIEKIEELSGRKYICGCHPRPDRESTNSLSVDSRLRGNDRASGEEIEKEPEDDEKGGDGNKAFRIIADHLKAAVFLLAENIEPSNKDRGYIVRRLIRRAIVKANEIGIKENFTAKIAEAVFDIYNSIYFDCHCEESSTKQSPLDPSTALGMTRTSDCRDRQSGLAMTREKIIEELEKEENKFRRNLEAGLKIINSQKEFKAKILFDLYQSYGIPIEIAIEEAAKTGQKIDNKTIQQFNNFVSEHRELSRTASAGMFKGGLADASEETTRLHTAAHLMLAALRKVLGDDVQQKGSNINAERLRFDFNYPEKLSEGQIREIENIVNKNITVDLPVTMKEMTMDEAKNSGATGIFDDRYGDRVKVYTIGDPSTLPRQARDRSGSRDFVSREICGGPHVDKTGKLGHFKIIKEESSSAGVRRVKAILE